MYKNDRATFSRHPYSGLFTMKRILFVFISIAAIFVIHPLRAQVDKPEGRVLSISGKTVIAQFEDATISVGDEVNIVRHEKIIDPVSGKIRGSSPVPVGKGFVVDFGLGKANLRVDEFEGKMVQVDDIVILTGEEKTIIRPEGPRFGEIQEVTDETIVTNLGTADEISPGDVFLIQRNEPVYDPDTKEIIGTNSVNVGRYSVDTVNNTTSVARILEQNLVPQKTDIVYKESEYLNYLVVMQSDSVRIARLEEEVYILKKQLRSVRTKLDSLGIVHAIHLNEFETLKRDIETVLTQIVSGDFKETTLRIKNDEPYPQTVTDDLLMAYKKALDDCLDHKLESAIQQFNAIIAGYPESKLTENCRYWIAQSYFSMKAYPQAAQGFSEVINDMRFDHKDDDASIMLGITYLRLNSIDEARGEFERFIRTYPQSEYRSKVEYWVSRLPSS